MALQSLVSFILQNKSIFNLKDKLKGHDNNLIYRISIKKKGDFYSKIENHDKINSDLSLHEMADKLGHLLSLSEFPNISTQEHHKGHLESTMHVAVVFCKPLIKDMITIEFERRISILLSQIKKDKLRPDTIAFVGGNDNKNACIIV